MLIQNQKIINGLETKKVLIAQARKLFARGFDSVNTTEIVEKAQVTRGALYHHFSSKKDLFRAVVETIAIEITAKIVRAAEKEHDLIEGIVSGSMEFLKVCQTQEIKKIYLQDAPSVLGWKDWREIDEQHSFGSLVEGLDECARQGLIRFGDVYPIAYLISGSLNEAVFLCSEGKLDKQTQTVLVKLLKKNIRQLLTKD